MELLLLVRIDIYLDLFYHISELEDTLEQSKEEEKMNIFMDSCYKMSQVIRNSEN